MTTEGFAHHADWELVAARAFAARANAQLAALTHEGASAEEVEAAEHSRAHAQELLERMRERLAKNAQHPAAIVAA